MTITINVNGSIELTPSAAMVELINRIIMSNPAPAEAPVEMMAEDAPAEIIEEEAPEEAAPAEQEAPAEAPDELRQISKPEMRAAMDDVFIRLKAKERGEENYAKYHNAIRDLFISISSSMGANKPTDIKDNEDRVKFLDIIKDIDIIDGEVKIKTPF